MARGYRKRKAPDISKKFVRLDNFLLKTAAWNDLKPDARALYIVLKSIFSGINNGHIFLSVRRAGEKINRHKDTASKAFKELESHGFIKPRQKGAFDYKKRHATEWILTEHEYNGQKATKDYLHWQPEEKSRAA